MITDLCIIKNDSDNNYLSSYGSFQVSPRRAINVDNIKKKITAIKIAENKTPVV